MECDAVFFSVFVFFLSPSRIVFAFRPWRETKEKKPHGLTTTLAKKKKRPLRLCIKSEHCFYHGISKNQAWLRFGAAMREVTASRATLSISSLLRDKNSVLILCIIVVAVFFFFFFFGQGSIFCAHMVLFLSLSNQFSFKFFKLRLMVAPQLAHEEGKSTRSIRRLIAATELFCIRCLIKLKTGIA